MMTGKQQILKDLKAARVRVTMNTGTRRHRPAKGKGSYRRRQKHSRRVEE